jgi:hypothetical protein
MLPPTKPSIKLPGLYIYWHQTELVIRAHKLTHSEKLKGEIILTPLVEGDLPGETELRVKGKFETTFLMQETKARVTFSANGDGQLRIPSRHADYLIIDFAFNLDPQFPLDQIYVGAEGIHPESHEFDVSIGKDRHGLSWADYNGDQQLDVLIVRGGQKGMMKQNSAVDKDELFIQKDSYFYDKIGDLGLIKNGCPARQVAPVDFDNNNQLDLYVVCGRWKQPPRNEFPNQLYQRNNETFIDVATERGLDILEDGMFTWLDADNDGDMDLVWVGVSQEFRLYLNRNGRFQPQAIGSIQGRIKQLTVSDYDADGDFDIFYYII